MKSRVEHVLVLEVPSFTDKDVSYAVRVRQDGVVDSCACPDASLRGNNYCKHVRLVYDQPEYDQFIAANAASIHEMEARFVEPSAKLLAGAFQAGVEFGRAR